tara:strand:+ start:1315 stop:1479 length:165 start_codon:yes stop_codon:yes gene_type:complete
VENREATVITGFSAGCGVGRRGAAATAGVVAFELVADGFGGGGSGISAVTAYES